MTICYLFPRVECLLPWLSFAGREFSAARLNACCERCVDCALFTSASRHLPLCLICRDQTTSDHGFLDGIPQDVLHQVTHQDLLFQTELAGHAVHSVLGPVEILHPLASLEARYVVGWMFSPRLYCLSRICLTGRSPGPPPFRCVGNCLLTVQV